ncbi:MAG: hypothetical protein ACREKL_09300, partial [Chthoniobacterales bacterium]
SEAAVEKLIGASLGDTERRFGIDASRDGTSYKDPRVCDFAAYVMSKRWPDKYQFDWMPDVAKCDAQIAVIQKRWCSQTGQLPASTAAAQVSIPPASEEDVAALLDDFADAGDDAARAAATASIVEKFGLSALPAVQTRAEKTKNAAFRSLAIELAALVREVRVEPAAFASRPEIAALKNQPLNGARLYDLAYALEEKMPNDMRAVTFVAERGGDGTGFVVKLDWLPGSLEGQRGWVREMAVRAGEKCLYDDSGAAAIGGFVREAIYRGFADAFEKAIEAGDDVPITARLRLVRSTMK